LDFLNYELDEDEEDVLERINALSDRVKNHLIRKMLSNAESLLTTVEECESPIEQLLAMELEFQANVIESVIGKYCIVSPQAQITANGKNYRVDFLIGYLAPDGRDYQVVVECDGHDFHEKTKEQAKKDKARDRALQAQGITVLRFTGSEIWESPHKCAREVTETIKSISGFYK
jgi:very-short-patch-repair endonuclease